MNELTLTFIMLSRLPDMTSRNQRKNGWLFSVW